MIVILSYILLLTCLLFLIGTGVISIIKRRDYSLLAKILPIIALPLGLVMYLINKKYKKLAKSLIFGSIYTFFFWAFIIDWFLIIYGGIEIMGVFWNPFILTIISLGLIILFEIYQIFIRIIYKGTRFLIKMFVLFISIGILSFCSPITNIIYLVFSEEFIFTSPFLLMSDGNIIDTMFVCLIELLGISFLGIFISWIISIIRKLINNAWNLIKKILLFALSFIGISIYPIVIGVMNESLIDGLFAYLSVLIFISLFLVFISWVMYIVRKIINEGWAFIIKIIGLFILSAIVIFVSYLLADGNIDPKSLKYGITETISKNVSTGINMLVIQFILLIILIPVTYIRTLIIKYNC